MEHEREPDGLGEHRYHPHLTRGRSRGSPEVQTLLRNPFRPAFLFAFVVLMTMGSASRSAAASESVATSDDARLVEAIAAQVGSEIVLASEVMELAAPVEERLRRAGAPESEIAMVRKDALERLIEAKLLSSVVERLELGADREEVDSAIAAIAAENDLSVDQLLRSIESHGLTVDEYRAKIRQEIERSKVVNAMVRSRVQISDEEVRALYEEKFGKQRDGGEEIYLRHILVRADGPRADSPQAACRIVRDLRARIAAGETSFGDAARQASDLNPAAGGELGWIHTEDLAKWMSDSVRAMKPGELSQPIEMPFGCNLLEVVDRRPFERVEFEEAEPQLRNLVFQQKTEVEYEKWLDVLREQTYIDRKTSFGG